MEPESDGRCFTTLWEFFVWLIFSPGECAPTDGVNDPTWLHH